MLKNSVIAIFLLISLLSCTSIRNDIVKIETVDPAQKVGLYLISDKMNDYQYDITRYFYSHGYNIYRIKYLTKSNDTKISQRETIDVFTTDLEVNQLNKNFIGALEELQNKGIHYVISLDNSGKTIFTEIWDTEKKNLIYSQAYYQKSEYTSGDVFYNYLLIYLNDLQKNISGTVLKKTESIKKETKSNEMPKESGKSEKSLLDFLSN